MIRKQPNFRLCFVCSIDNFVALLLAFCTDGQGRRMAHLRSGTEHLSYPGQLHGE
jgi:hypothetical protein